MDEVNCDECGDHICWVHCSGPAGGHYCDACAAELENDTGED